MKFNTASEIRERDSDLDGILSDNSSHALLERSGTFNIFVVPYQERLEPWLQFFVVYRTHVKLVTVCASVKETATERT